MRTIDVRTARRQILGVEQLPYLLRTQLLTADICLRLNDLAELYLQPPRHDQLIVAFQEVGHTPLARLTVDANDRVVRAAQIGRIDRQVGNVPNIGLGSRRETL